MFSVPKFVRAVCVFSAPGELHFFVAAIMLHFRHIPILYEEGLIDQGVATKAAFTLGPVLFRILANRTRRVDFASGLHSHYKRLTRRERITAANGTRPLCRVHTASASRPVVTQLHVLNS